MFQSHLWSEWWSSSFASCLRLYLICERGFVSRIWRLTRVRQDGVRLGQELVTADSLVSFSAPVAEKQRISRDAAVRQSEETQFLLQRDGKTILSLFQTVHRTLFAQSLVTEETRIPVLCETNQHWEKATPINTPSTGATRQQRIKTFHCFPPGC